MAKQKKARKVSKRHMKEDEGLPEYSDRPERLPQVEDE